MALASQWLCAHVQDATQCLVCHSGIVTGTSIFWVVSLALPQALMRRPKFTSDDTRHLGPTLLSLPGPSKETSHKVTEALLTPATARWIHIHQLSV